MNKKQIIKELKEAKKINFQDRLAFIDFYVTNLKKNPKKIFKEHNNFVNSLI